MTFTSLILSIFNHNYDIGKYRRNMVRLNESCFILPKDYFRVIKMEKRGPLCSGFSEGPEVQETFVSMDTSTRSQKKNIRFWVLGIA